MHLRRATGLPQIQVQADKERPPNSQCRVTVFPSSGRWEAAQGGSIPCNGNILRIADSFLSDTCTGFSQIVPSSCDPSWTQTFYLYVRDPASQKLEVCVEHVTDTEEEENIDLGKAVFDNLEALCDAQAHHLRRELTM